LESTQKVAYNVAISEGNQTVVASMASYGGANCDDTGWDGRNLNQNDGKRTCRSFYSHNALHPLSAWVSSTGMLEPNKDIAYSNQWAASMEWNRSKVMAIPNCWNRNGM